MRVNCSAAFTFSPSKALQCSRSRIASYNVFESILNFVTAFHNHVVPQILLPHFPPLSHRAAFFTPAYSTSTFSASPQNRINLNASHPIFKQNYVHWILNISSKKLQNHVRKHSLGVTVEFLIFKCRPQSIWVVITLISAVTGPEVTFADRTTLLTEACP